MNKFLHWFFSPHEVALELPLTETRRRLRAIRKLTIEENAKRYAERELEEVIESYRKMERLWRK